MPPSSSPVHADAQAVRDLVAAYERLTDQVGRTVVGQKGVIEQVLTALFSRGHCLLLGVPGIAKGLLVGTIGKVLQLSFHRVQFTPDLTAADVIGTDVVPDDAEPGRRRAAFVPGPLFANIVLAVDLNLGPPKTQAPVFAAMQDGAVSAGGQTYRLPDPFFVVATQSPIETEGAVPLPEARLDRFLFSVRVEYPTRAEEIQIVKATTGSYRGEPAAVLDGRQVARFQEVARQAVVGEHAFAYAADLVRATRPKEPQAPKFVPELVAWGAGPRASQALVAAGKTRAVLHGRAHVTTDDIRAVAVPVLRHRLTTTFHADAEGITPEAIVGMVLDSLPSPTDTGPAKGRKG